MIHSETVEDMCCTLVEIGCAQKEQLDKLRQFLIDFEKSLTPHALRYLDEYIKFLDHIVLFEMALQKAWSKETCYPAQANEWTSKNPALGQCAVTVLVVQKYLGGQILGCTHYHHYWNILPDGYWLDLTASQFPQGTRLKVDTTKTRDDILKGERAIAAETPARYFLLLARVENILREQE